MWISALAGHETATSNPTELLRLLALFSVLLHVVHHSFSDQRGPKLLKILQNPRQLR
jgi:hypothetical protein